MTDIDSTIREIAASRGIEKVSEKTIKAVKRALANSFIDSVLDKSAMTEVKVAKEEETKEEETKDESSDDDIMSDDDSEDDTDEKDEQTQKLKGVKVLTTDQPTTHSSAITGYRPGLSGMGQVG